MWSIPFVPQPPRAVSRLTVVVALATLLLAPLLHAEVLLEVDVGQGMPDGELVERVEAAVARRGIAIEPAIDTDARWHDVVLIDVDEAWDARFVASVPALNRGRNLYFDARFQDAVDALEPWLERVEADPAVLALHPDLVGPFVDSIIALSAAWDALGDHDAASAALARLARLTPAHILDDTQHAPAAVARWNEARSAAIVRRVDPAGTRDDCDVFHAGVPVTDAELGIPVTDAPGYAQLHCAGRDGAIYLASADGMVLDARLDDALVVQRGRVSLRPRAAGSAAELAAIGSAAARALDVEGAMLVAVRPGSRAALPSVEWVLARPDGSFRAARTTLDATDADMDAAAAWIVGGPEPGAISIWRDGSGWTPTPGDVFIPDVPRAATWITAAAAVTGIGVASFLEVQRADDASALTGCATDRACTESGDIERYRDDLRAGRSVANVGWATAGTLTAAAIVTAVAESPSVRFRERDRAVRATPGVGPRFVSVHVTF